jgi:hypothetical protein
LTFEVAEFVAPVLFAVAVAAIVIFGPRRGRMLPDEKTRAFAIIRSWASVAAIAVASVYMERWLEARFGLSYWPSLGVMLGSAIVIALFVQSVRGLIDKRAERASWP